MLIPPIGRNCETCKREYFGWGKRFCSQKCWYKSGGYWKNKIGYWRNKKRPPFSKEWRKKLSREISGKKNPNWQGGKSFEPYGLEFNEDLKEVIRNRDRRKCQICEKTELENKTKLDIHHIDYNKQNNNPNNLISLCKSCHIKIHTTMRLTMR